MVMSRIRWPLRFSASRYCRLMSAALIVPTTTGSRPSTTGIQLIRYPVVGELLQREIQAYFRLDRHRLARHDHLNQRRFTTGWRRALDVGQGNHA
jgi:hypothetical protein